MKTWKARVRIDGVATEIVVQTTDFGAAKRMIEAQYGKNSIVSVITEVK